MLRKQKSPPACCWRGFYFLKTCKLLPKRCQSCRAASEKVPIYWYMNTILLFAGRAALMVASLLVLLKYPEYSNELATAGFQWQLMELLLSGGNSPVSITISVNQRPCYCPRQRRRRKRRRYSPPRQVAAPNGQQAASTRQPETRTKQARRKKPARPVDFPGFEYAPLRQAHKQRGGGEAAE
jgi:hypothetical protein